MRKIRLELAAVAALLIAAPALITTPALAQSASGNAQWFVPKTAASSSSSTSQAGPRASSAPAAAASTAATQAQVGLPPLPSLPQIERGATPPAAVIGVLDVTGVLQSSTAYQSVQKELAARQNKLQADAQAEQAVWRELNQAITDQQKTLSGEQLAEKQKELQDRITEKEKEFKARDQLNQDASNYAYAQIQQVLNGIVQQVAESRGINLVLYQTQVVLNAREFEISAQVAQELNQILPSVLIPPDGADVAAFALAHEAKR